MKFAGYLLYNLMVIPLLYTGFWVGSFLNRKMKTGRKARQGQFNRLRKELAQADSGRRRILFHCTSAGEWLQALPIIEQMKFSDPSLYIVVSFFSPSGFSFARNPASVDLKCYLPLDSICQSRRFLKLLRPSLWVISKFDIWPNHLLAAWQLKIPVVVTSATLASDSRRNTGIAGLFNRTVYAQIAHFFAISEADRDRFLKLVPDAGKYTVAGDTRYDHVFSRGEKAREAGDVELFGNKPQVTLIAGSTWPADEKHVLPAFLRILNEYPETRAIVVPHELPESHLLHLESAFIQAGVTCERYTSFAGKRSTQARVVIFDTVGMLARLYKHTDIAFIGGSFGKGTHNTMEPAVFGQPVLVGPNHLNAFEAIELIKHGAAFSVGDSDELFRKLALLINQPGLRNEMGQRARNLILNNVGATQIIMNKLKKDYGIVS